jgi:hypothetical protein
MRERTELPIFTLRCRTKLVTLARQPARVKPTHKNIHNTIKLV